MKQRNTTGWTTMWMVGAALALAVPCACVAQSSAQNPGPTGSSSGQGASSSSGQLPGVDSGSGSSATTAPSRGSTKAPSLPLGDEVPGNPGRLNDDQMENVRNIERQKKLVEDTDKLVALVNQLKAEVDKSNKDTLSLDVVRKADEIEKLARSVRDKMKGT